MVDSGNKWKHNIIFFSFDEDSCHIGDGLNSKYLIKRDSLIITEKRKKFDGPDKWKYAYVPCTFIIKNLDRNTLVLHYENDDGQNPFDLKRIKLDRIIAKNNLVFDTIGFYYSSWYDVYNNETQYIELYASGEYLMEIPHQMHLTSAIKQDLGVLDTNQNIFTGMIDDKKIENINKLIEYIPLDSLEEYYTSTATHQNSARIIIKFDGNTYETGSYGYSAEPIGLRMLYREMKHLYVVSNLQPDTEGLEKFNLVDFYNRRFTHDMRTRRVNKN